MNPAIWIAIFLPLFVIFLQRRRRKHTWVTKHLSAKKKTECDDKMVELAKQMVGKECIIYMMESQVTGIIQEVNDGAILLVSGNDTDVINLSFVMRIREYPRGKNGKKKSVIWD